MKQNLLRIPIRVTREIARFSHGGYMALLVPLLKAAGMDIKGRPSFIAPTASFDDFESISLGNGVIISGEVKFLTHDYSYTTVLVAKGEHKGEDVARIGRITVGSNVFIGFRSIILPGTTIGNNVIIGAGSIVRGTVDDGQILLGNPAIPVSSIEELYDKYTRKADSLTLRADT